MILKKLITTKIEPPIDDGLPKAAPLRLEGLRFPSGKVAGLLVMFVIGGMFVFRLSETGGRASKNACAMAILVASVAAIIGVIPVLIAWGRRLLLVVLSVFLSGAIRLLIGLIGVVIIIRFTAIERTKFVGYLALFYIVFTGADIWLSLWALRHSALKTETRETVDHGNG